LTYFIEHVVNDGKDEFDEEYENVFNEEEKVEGDGYNDYLVKIDSILGTHILKHNKS